MSTNLCDQHEENSLSQMMGEDSNAESTEILTSTSEFVPTSSSLASPPPVSWQVAMKRAIRSGPALRKALGLENDPHCRSAESFPTFVPLEYLARIRPGDPQDPLLLQVLPRGEETASKSGFVDDPVGDRASLVGPGLLHKYSGRGLIISNGSCGIHCRYCFRREFPYAQLGSRTQNWAPALSLLEEDHSIDEVILSGGDPLTLEDQPLFDLIHRIESIEHVRRLRIHSRMPIAIPQRVTKSLVARLAASRLTVWTVIHANHPRELDGAVLDRLSLLCGAGIPVLNQAVLLRGVNDDADTLIDLCRLLVDHRVQPYYLHQLDRARGTAHFEVSVEKGKRLMAELQAALPGYAVPKYVIEQPGEKSKTPLVS